MRRNGIRRVALGWFLAMLAFSGPGPAEEGEVFEKRASGSFPRRQGAPAGPGPSAADVDRLVQQEDFVGALLQAATRASVLSDRLGADHEDTLAALEQVGVIAHISGAQDSAVEFFEHTLERRRRVLGPSHPAVAETLVHLGQVARYLGRRDVAWRYYEQARAILEPLGGQEHRRLAEALQSKANWLRKTNLGMAAERYREALDLRRQHANGPAFDIADNLVWLGWTLFHAGRHAEGLSCLEEAEKQLRALGLDDHTLLGVIRSARADHLAVSGQWPAADQAYRESTAIFERARRRHPPGFSRRKSPPHGYEALALTQLMQDRPEEAWRSLQHYLGSVTRDFMLLARWHERAPASFEEVAALRREWVEARSSRPVSVDSSDDEVRERVKRLARRVELEARIAGLEHEFLELHEVPQPSLGLLRSALGPVEAYLGWMHVRVANDPRQSKGPYLDQVWAYVVRRSGIRWVCLYESFPRPDNWIDDPRTLYILRLERAGAWPMAVEADRDLERLGREVSKRWIDPLLPLLDGVETLIIETSRAVPLLPVHALSLADGSAFGERFAIAWVPSASAFLMLESRASEEKDIFNRPLLAVGDPLPPAAPTSPAGAMGLARDVGAAPFGRLSYSGREIDRVAALFPVASVLLRQSASEAVLSEMAHRGELSEFGAIHIATHTITSAQPERCALMLSAPDPDGSLDGVVDSGEILGTWSLDAGLVTLAGCGTGKGNGMNSQGEFLGLPQALLAAGARSVVASLWNMDDRVTALLMERFYENLAGAYVEDRGRGPGVPMSKAAALREASQWLRHFTDERGNRPFEHPIYWSGFIVLGSPD